MKTGRRRDLGVPYRFDQVTITLRPLKGDRATSPPQCHYLRGIYRQGRRIAFRGLASACVHVYIRFQTFNEVDEQIATKSLSGALLKPGPRVTIEKVT